MLFRFPCIRLNNLKFVEGRTSNLFLWNFVLPPNAAVPRDPTGYNPFIYRYLNRPDRQYFLEGWFLPDCHMWFSKLCKECNRLESTLLVLKKSVWDEFEARPQLHVKRKGSRPYVLDTFLKGQEKLWPSCGTYFLSVYGPPCWITRCLQHQDAPWFSHKNPTLSTEVIEPTSMENLTWKLVFCIFVHCTILQ